MANGCLIVCDGSNGAGKTTVIKAIEAHVKKMNRDVVMTREPGGTPIGEKIRTLVLDPLTPEMEDITELLLFSAARAQHLREKILPAIAAGKVVVSDRFVAATVSFQHYARGLDINMINQVNKLALGDFAPDMNIILDLDPVVGLQRVAQRGDGIDRMEDQKLEFLQKAREGYLRQASDNPQIFSVIDAAQPLEKVIEEALRIVDRLLAR